MSYLGILDDMETRYESWCKRTWGSATLVWYYGWLIPGAILIYFVAFIKYLCLKRR